MGVPGPIIQFADYPNQDDLYVYSASPIYEVAYDDQSFSDPSRQTADDSFSDYLNPDNLLINSLYVPAAQPANTSPEEGHWEGNPADTDSTNTMESDPVYEELDKQTFYSPPKPPSPGDTCDDHTQFSGRADDADEVPYFSFCLSES